MKPWIASPVTTVTIYIPRAFNSATGSAIPIISAATRNRMPIGEYLEHS